MRTSIVWLHNDLRTRDNPALHHAASEGHVLPLFAWAPSEEKDWQPGGAHKWWLHHSLSELAKSLTDAGSPLVLQKGPSLDAILKTAKQSKASHVYWNERYEPLLRRRDLKIQASLRDTGLEVKTFQGALLHDPDEIRTNKGDPYRVFTPFWKKFKDLVAVPQPLPAPQLTPPSNSIESLAVEDLELLPTIDWAGGLRETWTPGEKGAHDRINAFIDEGILTYHDRRDRPDLDGTSTVSPHLRYGEISPRQIWNAVTDQHPRARGAMAYLREIGWREFSYHLLYHFPHTTTKPLNERFKSFPWSGDKVALKRWQKGLTGYPIVDAGMRQLWHTGWMHNRVRMIVASFLTKDLLIRWQEGAAWFWDTLVDGDLANNTQGWQWSAGCGADAQPFFRIFNPVSQGRKFDPEGAYVRKWIPEIAELPAKLIHAPWEASPAALKDAGVVLGDTYPEPIVDHSDARKSALAAFEKLR